MSGAGLGQRLVWGCFHGVGVFGLVLWLGILLLLLIILSFHEREEEKCSWDGAVILPVAHGAELGGGGGRLWLVAKSWLPFRCCHYMTYVWCEETVCTLVLIGFS